MKKNIIIVAVNIHKYKSIIENPIIKKYYKFYFLKYIYFLFIMQIMYSVVQKIKKLQSNNKLRLIQLIKSQSTLGDEAKVLKARCLGLRRVRNYATPFHNFLQNYFTPFSSSQSVKANDESAARHIKSFAPTSVLYNGLRASTHWLYSPTWIDF